MCGGLAACLGLVRSGLRTTSWVAHSSPLIILLRILLAVVYGNDQTDHFGDDGFWVHFLIIFIGAKRLDSGLFGAPKDQCIRQ